MSAVLTHPHRLSAVGAYFEKKFDSLAVRRGEGARLQCRAFGEAPLAISWSRDRLPISPLNEQRCVSWLQILLTRAVSLHACLRLTHASSSLAAALARARDPFPTRQRPAEPASSSRSAERVIASCSSCQKEDPWVDLAPPLERTALVARMPRSWRREREHLRHLLSLSRASTEALCSFPFADQRASQLSQSLLLLLRRPSFSFSHAAC